MKHESCSNCKHGQMVWLHAGKTHGGVHSSDSHIDMYICQFKRAQHYGHIMIGDHWCVGFGQRNVEKDR
ncbi:MAG: hypothetical protein SVM79_10740 [Chloroflexota bacterium]|nr:hypothetical protein [Chloroflexota bacterium]